MSPAPSTAAEDLLFEDAAEGTHAIVAALASNERPLRGLAGRLDWRFQGAISRAIQSGIVSGKPGELLYLPLAKAGRIYHLLLAGAGVADPIGRRRDLPVATREALIANLKGIKLSSIVVSEWDLGPESLAAVKKIKDLRPKVTA